MGQWDLKEEWVSSENVHARMNPVIAVSSGNRLIQGSVKHPFTLKVNTLDFSKSMAAEFSTIIVTWASFRTVCGTTRKIPPGPTSLKLNLALAPWKIEFRERKQGK